MRTSLKFTLALVAALGLATGTAWAATTITFSPTGLHEVSAFPHTMDVSAEFETDDEDGLCITAKGTDWRLWVEDDTEAEIASAEGSYLKIGTPPVCTAGSQKTETIAGVVFPEAGTYTLKGTLKTRQGGDLDLEAEDELVLELEQEIIVTYPAAPSVAARILEDAEVPARYGSGKTGGNHIADTAEEMNKTPRTDFRGVAKTDVAAYEAEVRAFLEEKGAL